MAHSETYQDGTKIHQILSGRQKDMANKMGSLSTLAFLNGATAVEQKLMNDNEECVCGSGLRFDLCCKNKAVELSNK